MQYRILYYRCLYRFIQHFILTHSLLDCRPKPAPFSVIFKGEPTSLGRVNLPWVLICPSLFLLKYFPSSFRLQPAPLLFYSSRESQIGWERVNLYVITLDKSEAPMTIGYNMQWVTRVQFTTLNAQTARSLVFDETGRNLNTRLTY